MLKQGIKQRAMMLLAWLWRFYSRRFNQVGLRRFLLHERFGYPLDFTFEVDQSALKQRLRETALHRHDEYLYDYQQACYIEPSYGFIITKHLFLIKRSFAYDHMVQSVPICNGQRDVAQALNHLSPSKEGENKRCWGTDLLVLNHVQCAKGG